MRTRQGGGVSGVSPQVTPLPSRPLHPPCLSLVGLVCKGRGSMFSTNSPPSHSLWRSQRFPHHGQTTGRNAQSLLARGKDREAASRLTNSRGQLVKLRLPKLQQLAERLHVPWRKVERLALVERLAPRLGSQWFGLRAVLLNDGDFGKWLQSVR